MLKQSKFSARHGRAESRAQTWGGRRLQEVGRSLPVAVRKHRSSQPERNHVHRLGRTAATRGRSFVASSREEALKFSATHGRAESHNSGSDEVVEVSLPDMEEWNHITVEMSKQLKFSAGHGRAESFYSGNVEAVVGVVSARRMDVMTTYVLSCCCSSI